jgi:hypothetical protein
MAFHIERQSEWDAWLLIRSQEKADAVLADLELDHMIAYEDDTQCPSTSTPQPSKQAETLHSGGGVVVGVAVRGVCELSQ